MKKAKQNQGDLLPDHYDLKRKMVTKFVGHTVNEIRF